MVLSEKQQTEIIRNIQAANRFKARVKCDECGAFELDIVYIIETGAEVVKGRCQSCANKYWQNKFGGGSVR